MRVCSKSGCCDRVSDVYDNISTGSAYCDVHHRFRRMRANAKVREKYVPSDEELALLVPVGMCCPHCNKKMIWFSFNGKSERANVISLQHWGGKKISLICNSCNNSHGHLKGGTKAFRAKNELAKNGLKQCLDCGKRKLFTDFRGPKRGHTYYSYCNPCTDARTTAWKNMNGAYHG